MDKERKKEREIEWGWIHFTQGAVILSKKNFVRLYKSLFESLHPNLCGLTNINYLFKASLSTFLQQKTGETYQVV